MVNFYFYLNYTGLAAFAASSGSLSGSGSAENLKKLGESKSSGTPTSKKVRFLCKNASQHKATRSKYFVMGLFLNPRSCINSSLLHAFKLPLLNENVSKESKTRQILKKMLMEYS